MVDTVPRFADADTPPADTDRRWVRWVRWTFVVALVAAALLPYALVRSPGVTADVSLPDRIEGYYPFTSDARDEPVGRGLLIFQSGNNEWYDNFQVLVVGADGRTYRSVGATDGWLSPDGSTVLFEPWAHPGTTLPDYPPQISSFELLDLASGKTRRVPIPVSVDVVVHAWSPDGQVVAFSHLTRPPVRPDVRSTQDNGTLSLLDLRTGAVTDPAGVARVAAVAFAPDSNTMAVQTGDQVVLLDRAGQRLRTVDRPDPGMREIARVGPALGLLPGPAWSPDGRWLAMVSYDFPVGQAGVPRMRLPGYEYDLYLVDATGAGAPARGPIRMSSPVLGWRSAESVLTWTGHGLDEVSLRDGHRDTLAAFVRRDICEPPMFQYCNTWTMRAASDLIRTARVVPASTPQRGRGVMRFQLLLSLAIIGLPVAIVVGLARWRRRRSRP